MSRKIDALIAEHVMNKVVYFSKGEFVEPDGTPINDYRMRSQTGSYREFVPHYSTDIRDALEVLYRNVEPSAQKSSSVSHIPDPMEICLAALKAKGINYE